MLELRKVFESAYPGKEVIFNEVIKPIFDKAKDATLTDNQQLSENDKRLVKSFSIIAQVRGGFPITFADVELKDTVALKRSRVAIQNCVRKIMTNDSSAIIFFHFTDNTKDWRVSFVNKGESGKDSTTAKRYTYLCGVNHGCRTIAERFNTLAKLDRITDKDMITAFSVESLTKEFFGQLFTWYSDWACKICKFPSEKCIAADADLTTDKNEINLIRLITRIMFVWFIKQKNLIPSWIFNKEELAGILTDADLTSDKKGNYYNAVLQNLFFGALNKKIEERGFADVSTAGIANEQYGIKTYFRDANEGSFFKFAPKDMVKKFLDVPFLNGGLFECLDYDVPHGENSHKVHYVDGFSREKSRRAFVPNILFWNEDEKQPGLFTILSRYNFTVEESTPNDVQVALDPELLGKIFENLLGTYNPETRESARKESGSFYTPREIVSYMVNSSIKAYLQEKVPEVSEENLEKLTNDDKADDSQIELTEDQINKIRKSLFQIKIIDPACGSGAFPMGILNKLVEIHVLLDKLSARTKSEHNLYIKKGQSVNYNPDESLKINAEYLGNQEFKLSVNGNTEDEIYNSQDLALHVKEIINKYNKELGKKTIANLFSQGRIDDGKSFNSIKTKTDIHQIVDEETNDIIWQYRSYNVQNKFRQYRNQDETDASVDFEEDNDFEYAKYLYSLKTRIIQDSIFGVDIQPIAVQISKLRFFISLICEQPKIENHPEENYGYNPLPNLETKFVAANTLIGKAKKTDENSLFANPRIDEITKELGEIRKAHFSAKTAQEKKENREQDEKLRKELSKLLEEEQVYSPEDAKQLAEWNPYDQSAPESSFFDAEWMFGVKDGFDVVIGNPPYVNINIMPQMHKIFKEAYPEIHTGYNDLMYYFICKGIQLLNIKGILSFITSNYFLGNDYAKKLRLFLNDKLEVVINFHDATVFENASVHTAISFAKKNTLKSSIKFYTLKTNNLTSLVLDDSFEKCELERKNLSDTWVIANSNSTSIITKLKEKSILLGEIAEVAKGSETGKNGIFSVPKQVIEDNKIEREIVRQCIKNSHVQRYAINKIDLWLVYCDNEFSQKKYPNAYSYLEKFRNDLLDRRGPRTGEYEWWRLHRPSEKVIHDAKEKLVVPYRAEHNRFAYDNEQCFNDGGDIRAIVLKEGSGFSIKFVLGLLNSKLLDWYYGFIGKPKGNAREYFNKPLSEIPIVRVAPERQKPIIDLVDKILATKKANHTADTTALEAEIDRLVYALYGLSEDEIKIVEGR